MGEYETGYMALGGYDDYDTDENGLPSQEAEVMIHVVPERSKARWNHIENLDDFFTRVYHYHQRHGFLCMVLEDILQLVQFFFVVIFSTFLIECVNYDVLFANVHYNTTHKVTIPEAVVPLDQCIEGFDFVIVVCLLVAFVFWMLRLLKVIYNIFQYNEIRSFYTTALRISGGDLLNLTWHEVQRQLLDVQKEQQMCIHKQDLTQLDIYHRILRFKNYMIAMVNKSLLQMKFPFPFLDKYAFFSTSLKYNMEFILFWGPWSPFENNWHLKEEYKDVHNRKHLSQYLAKRILWLGIANLTFSPIIFLWQILYFFFRYAELIKRQPGLLGSRRWSNYGRLYLRHYNELDHEFNARLNRGYKPATAYLNSFTNPLLVILAKNVAFFAGSVLAVLVVLTVIDEDVISVEHIITTMTLAGLVVTVCRVLIPDEHAVHCPELLLRKVLAHIHYMPDEWRGNAHTQKVRSEFSDLFQYKAVYLIEELFSPLITPFILCFSLRYKTLEIVDFFRNFTVEVVGVGDVCAFAQMDIRKHGNPEWVNEEETEADTSQQGEDGKIELSLMHFHLTNPEWKLPDNCSLFINTVKEQAHRDVASLNSLQINQNPVLNSYLSLSGGTDTGDPIGVGYYSMQSSLAAQSGLYPSMQYSNFPSLQRSMGVHAASSATASTSMKVRGAVTNCEGPVDRQSSGVLGSLQTSGHFQNMPHVDEGTLEFLSTDMSFSALYLHEMRHKRNMDSLDELRGKSLFNRQNSAGSQMPDIQEQSLEEDHEEEINTELIKDDDTHKKT